jgi:hypothetical protein
LETSGSEGLDGPPDDADALSRNVRVGRGSDRLIWDANREIRANDPFLQFSTGSILFSQFGDAEARLVSPSVHFLRYTGWSMPTISTFYGILIPMFFNDHPPPHFHARYGEFEVTINIETLAVAEGELP